MSKKPTKFKNNNSKILKSVIIGSFIGIILCVALLILSALALTKSSGIPHLAVGPLVMIVAGVGAFAGGYVSARISQQNGMLCGMMCSLLMFFTIFIAGLITVRDSLSMMTVIRILLMLLTGGVGGIFGVNKQRRVKY